MKIQNGRNIRLSSIAMIIDGQFVVIRVNKYR